MAVAAIKSPKVEELTAFLEYLDLNQDIQRKLDHAISLVDTAKGYVGELKTARAIFCAVIDDIQERLECVKQCQR